MSQYDFGVLNPATTSGTALADHLKLFRDALHSGHLGAARPAYLKAGATWSRQLDADTIQVLLWDGTGDREIGRLNLLTDVWTPYFGGQPLGSAALLSAADTQLPVGLGPLPWTAAVAPPKWILGNGQNLDRVIYAGLFTEWGTTYGAGDGSTTFGTRDTRGWFIRGLPASGRAIGSQELDQMQQITGSLGLMAGADVTSAGALAATTDLFRQMYGSAAAASHAISFDSANSPDARVGDETRGKNLAFPMIFYAGV